MNLLNGKAQIIALLLVASVQQGNEQTKILIAQRINHILLGYFAANRNDCICSECFIHKERNYLLVFLFTTLLIKCRDSPSSSLVTYLYPVRMSLLEDIPLDDNVLGWLFVWKHIYKLEIKYNSV